MKIITCITRMIRGGAQRLALETAAHLTALGHDAPIWCGPETGPEGSLHEEAARRGVRVRIFPQLLRAVSPWADLRVIGELAEALRQERPDWLHTHSSKAGIVGREAARRAGVPRVAHTVHGWGFTPQTPPLLRHGFIALERRAAPRGRILFVQPGDLEEGVRLGILRRGEGRIIPPGIDLRPYQDEAKMRQMRGEIRARIGIAPDRVVGGFLGRLSPQKDPAMVLQVAALLRAEHPEVEWIVAGDGPLGPQLRRTTLEGTDLAGRVHWAGLVHDPAPWLAAADFLFLPSRWEGAPLTVMEAMAAGLPLVASDLAGIRWLAAGAPVPDEAPVAGSAAATERAEGPAEAIASLARPGSAAEFEAGVLRWVRDPEARRAAGGRAREIAGERYGFARMFRQLREVYGIDAT